MKKNMNENPIIIAIYNPKKSNRYLIPEAMLCFKF